MEGITVEVKPGMTVWSDVLGANVEVLRVHKSTATVRVWGRGLAEGKLMTFRGQRLDSLRPKRDELFRVAALAMEEMKSKVTRLTMARRLRAETAPQGGRGKPQKFEWRYMP